MANNFIPVRLEYSGGSVPTGWAEYQTGETAVLPGNLNFAGNGRRITGDFTSPAGSVANRLWFQSSTVNGQTMLPVVPNGTSAISGAQLFGGSDVENTSVLIVQNNGAVGQILMGATGTGTQLPLVFGTSSTERMRLDTSGAFYVGTTSTDPVAAQSVGMYRGPAGSLGIYASAAIPFRIGVPSGTATMVSFTSNGSTTVGAITTNGTTTTYGTSSDYRLKDNVQPLDAGEATDRIMAYRPVTWTWKTDGSYGKGFIAHECQAVDPMTATGTKDQMERVGSVILADGTLVAESVREPEDPSIYGEGATWDLTEVRAVYQGRDDSKMIPDMIAMMQRMELRIRELEGQLQQALSQMQAA